MFKSVFSQTVQSIDPLSAAYVLLTALLCGLLFAIVFYLTEKCNGGFFLALVMLPIAVSVIIMFVNGSIGYGIAIAGAFGLVKFRSYQGKAKEIAALFLAMTAGLVAGTGYVLFAIAFCVFSCIVFFIISKLPLNMYGKSERNLKITIPEELNYAEAFDDIFKEYTSRYNLERVKTTAMGTLYELQYTVVLRDVKKEKDFIDALRCRNANLNIICTVMQLPSETL